MTFLLLCAFLRIGYTRLSFFMWGTFDDLYIILKSSSLFEAFAKVTWVQAARMRHSPTCAGLSWQAWQTGHQHLRFCEVNVWYDGWSMKGNVPCPNKTTHIPSKIRSPFTEVSWDAIANSADSLFVPWTTCEWCLKQKNEMLFLDETINNMLIQLFQDFGLEREYQTQRCST